MGTQRVAVALLLIGPLLLFLVANPCSARQPGAAVTLDNGLARSPPLGWDSWNRFRCDVDERRIRAGADALIRSGLAAAGYRYVIVDDCWQGIRGADGRLSADPRRFPSGMRALADYVHARGLKFGLYSDAGEFSCQHRPGSRGHERQDAQEFAAWGVDYLKYDWCYTRGIDPPSAYRLMHDALAATGRPIVLSVCEWGVSKPWMWAATVGNLWRTTGDIADCFDCGPLGHESAGSGAVPMGLGVLQVLDREASLSAAAGPGHWNDPDMLEIGNGGMSATEYRAQLSLWSMLAAPLILGNDLLHMGATVRSIIANREVIAIDQDGAGIQARRLRRTGDADIWVKPLADGGRAVALLNRGRRPMRVSLASDELGAGFVGVHVRDLWAHRDLLPWPAHFSARIAGHSVLLLRLGPVRPRGPLSQ